MNIPLKSVAGLFTAFFQEGPAYWFDFLNINNQEKMKSNDAFEIPLILYYGPGSARIQIRKQANDYYYIQEKKQLTYANDIVAGQLEEIWQNAKGIHQTDNPVQHPKWRSVNATVIQDPQRLGKAYLVQQIQFF